MLNLVRSGLSDNKSCKWEFSMENISQKCYFCLEDARYTCPRCNLPYCSRICYQSQDHVECSESFYKECVEEELHLEGSASTNQRQMLEILNKFQSDSQVEELLSPEDSDDEDPVPDLSERMQNVDLNDVDEVWNRLTEEEKSKFSTILRSGEITNLIPEYKPWWNQRFEKKIEDLETYITRSKEYKKSCPAVKETVPFHTLSKVQPYRHMLWNIVNLLSSYVLVVRRYIGEHQNDIAAAKTLLNLSANLKSNENFESKETAIESVIHRAKIDLKEPCSEYEVKLLYEDITKILVGPKSTEMEYYILAALSDIQELLSYVLGAKKSTNQKHKKLLKNDSVTSKPIGKEIVKRSVRKLTFYMSWTRKFYNKNLQ